MASASVVICAWINEGWRQAPSSSSGAKFDAREREPPRERGWLRSNYSTLFTSKGTVNDERSPLMVVAVIVTL